MIHISKSKMHWMEQAARREIEGCRRTAKNGIALFTPDGVGNYGALWTRDFAYMLPLFDLFKSSEALAAIRYLIEGQRSDGIVPDRRRVDGISVYEAGGIGHPVALPPLDNSFFLVFLVYEYISHTEEYHLIQEFLLPLHWAMQAIPRGTNGLVANNPQMPHSPYGFTDTVGKTGELLFCSLLDWKASCDLVELCKREENDHLARLYKNRCKEIEEGIHSLADSKTGMYFAASEDCRQLDIWGNAYALSTGFKIPIDQVHEIVNFYAENYDQFIERGQIRHLIKGNYWERMLIPVAHGDYQNGGYWGTPTGWMMKTLSLGHPDMAERLLNDLVEDYQQRGIHEWVNGYKTRLPHYVASIANPLAAIRDMLASGKAKLV